MCIVYTIQLTAWNSDLLAPRSLFHFVFYCTSIQYAKVPCILKTPIQPEKRGFKLKDYWYNENVRVVLLMLGGLVIK